MVDIEKPFDKQTEEDYLWSRNLFGRGLTNYSQFFNKLPKTVICGHTPGDNVREWEDRICLDTGAVFGGGLSCMLFPEREVIKII